MVEKPDAGRIVDQQAVPILPDDTALEVFAKVTVAAEMVLDRSLPALVAGSAALRAQDLSAGSYFGGRRPEDGRIDWTWPSGRVHDLVRAVAPPYPGAFCDFNGGDFGGARLRVLRTLRSDRAPAPGGRAALVADGDELLVRCADGAWLRLLAAELDGARLDAALVRARFGRDAIDLTN
jgi:methionyl-tRNA formyltransferase